MAQIKINFDDTPDQIIPLPAGEYVFVIREAEIKPTNDGEGTKLVVRLEVDMPQLDRWHKKSVFEHIGLAGDGAIRVKRLGKAAGVPMGANGLDTDTLVGKHVKALVANRTYKDKETGEMKEASNIKDYLV